MIKTVFATGILQLGNAPMCIDHHKIPNIVNFVRADYATRIAAKKPNLLLDKKFDMMNPDGFSHFNDPIFSFNLLL